MGGGGSLNHYHVCIAGLYTRLVGVWPTKVRPWQFDFAGGLYHGTAFGRVRPASYR
jgi:hypothetical protein